MSEMVVDPVELDLSALKDDFPILQQTARGKPLVYLDSGATSQKPQSVIDAISHYYSHDNANVHRGVYELSERATAIYETTRQTIRNFINAKRNHEIIFTRGTTEAINLVAHSFGLNELKPGDEVLMTVMEHHSSIVPWQMVCEQTGAKLRVAPIHEDGSLDMERFRLMLNDRTKIVNIIHVSNVLGTINPIKEIVELAHANNTPVLVDGAQAVPHMEVDVQDLDCDFYAFSAHKMYGPTGTGVLYGKEEWLDRLPPYQFGGDMISRVSFEHTDFNVLPHKFEAGTPNVAGAIGLGAAIEYLNKVGMQYVHQHEKSLTAYATTVLSDVPNLRIIGTASQKIGVISFVLDTVHPHDIATILDAEGVAIRVGHHCAMPLMDHLGLPATARLSFGVYNQPEDVDALVEGLDKVTAIFGDN